MSHGSTIVPGKGICIYCGHATKKLTDEHALAFALGGRHVLADASCEGCAKVTSGFERDVARELWGDARISYNAPTRRKKQRKQKTHVTVMDSERPDRILKVPYSEYPAAMVFYKMHPAGVLQGLPESVDTKARWQLVAIIDETRAAAYTKKYQAKPTSKFRNVSESFGRMLAKVGYCQVLTQLDPGDFDAKCLPYIMGSKPNISHIVGGTFDAVPPNPGLGYVLGTRAFGDANRMVLVAEIRLFASNGTPIYHAVIGEVSGLDNIAKVMRKLGPGTIAVDTFGSHNPRQRPAHHWCPATWPLPNW